LQVCSDDDRIYPNQLVTSLSASQYVDDKWNFVEPGHDQRPNILPDFKEKTGPTFSVDSSSSPATFFNEMLPDSLYDYILTCTNTRARIHYDSIPLSPQYQEKWKAVRLFLHVYIF
jgi:hypothetical protein